MTKYEKSVDQGDGVVMQDMNEVELFSAKMSPFVYDYQIAFDNIVLWGLIKDWRVWEGSVRTYWGWSYDYDVMSGVLKTERAGFISLKPKDLERVLSVSFERKEFNEEEFEGFYSVHVGVKGERNFTNLIMSRDSKDALVSFWTDADEDGEIGYFEGYASRWEVSHDPETRIPKNLHYFSEAKFWVKSSAIASIRADIPVRLNE